MAVVNTSELYGTDFWDMEGEMLYTASEHMGCDDHGNPYPFVINTSVKVDTGELAKSRSTGREVVYKRPTIEMQLIMFDSEEAKQEYLRTCEAEDKARYNRK